MYKITANKLIFTCIGIFVASFIFGEMGFRKIQKILFYSYFIIFPIGFFLAVKEVARKNRTVKRLLKIKLKRKITSESMKK